MGKVFLNMSMSLDGISAGPNPTAAEPIGEEGERLHAWMGVAEAGASEADARVVGDLIARTGAVVLGKRLFDVGVEAWADTPFPAPCFVLTHEAREDLVMSSGTFSFVTDGIEPALRRAKVAAGERDVLLNGGADMARQYVRAGLVDEIEIHLVPVLLGVGTRLFDELGVGPVELERIGVVDSPRATHLRYRVVTG